jgi:tRNA (guanine37-N1)-methyltransferase
MRIDVITLFPTLIEEFSRVSLIGRAVDAGVVDIRAYDLRQHGLGRHRAVDDQPYGGGAGMVMRPEPIAAAVEGVAGPGSHVVLMSPRGPRLDHRMAERLATQDHLVLICGRYEGVDERIAEAIADEEISIGDYVLGGGELPALVVVETVARLIPGVLGNEESLGVESHAGGLLEHPHYTRPPEWRGHEVPEVLLSGNHAAIAEWRHREAVRITRERRPDMVAEDQISTD